MNGDLSIPPGTADEEINVFFILLFPIANSQRIARDQDLFPDLRFDYFADR